MNKYAPFVAALMLASTAMPAFAQHGYGTTGNMLEDGSANPVNNSMSMGNKTPGSKPLIKGNSPVILDNKNAAPAVPMDKTTTTDAKNHHHPHRHHVQKAEPDNANPMGAGR